MTRQLAVRRPVSDEEFIAACETWHPKIVRFATNRIPFLDWDDKIQEAEMVLYNCLQLFEEGFLSKKDGAGKNRKTIFHTYFHRALHNRAGILSMRPLMHNAETARIVPVFGKDGEPKLKDNGEQAEKCVENPSNITYLGEMEGIGEDVRRFAAETKALAVPFDPSLVFEVESWGFEGMEVAYMLGKAIHQMTLTETAALFGVDVASLELAREMADAKIQILAIRGRGTV